MDSSAGLPPHIIFTSLLMPMLGQKFAVAMSFSGHLICYPATLAKA